MKINRSAVITDPKGRPFNEAMTLWREPDADKEAPEGSDKLTLGFICYIGLNHGLMEEQKYKLVQERHALIQKLYSPSAPDDVDLTAKEVSMLQELLTKMIGKGLGAWVVGQAGALMEPPAQ